MKQAQHSAMTPRNIVSTGIFPYNRDLFTDVDFAPSTIKDRAPPEAAEVADMPTPQESLTLEPIPGPAPSNGPAPTDCPAQTEGPVQIGGPAQSDGPAQIDGPGTIKGPAPTHGAAPIAGPSRSYDTVPMIDPAPFTSSCNESHDMDVYMSHHRKSTNFQRQMTERRQTNGERAKP